MGFKVGLPEQFENWTSFYDEDIRSVINYDPDFTTIITDERTGDQYLLEDIKRFAFEELMEARMERVEVYEFQKVFFSTINYANSPVMAEMWERIKKSLLKTARK
jgi:hypothetical protein